MIMARLFLFLIVLIVAAIITVVKSSVGRVTGNEDLKNTTVKHEAKNVMDKTAKGIGWMEDHWEEAKKNAKQTTKND